MKDYPQWRMFREARTADATDLAWPVVGLVSGFAEGRPVEDAIKAHWRAWHQGRGLYRVVVYGTCGGREDGYVLFNVEERRRAELEALLARLAGEHQQPGYILGDSSATALVTHAGRIALPPFDGKIETLDGWYGHLKPGFLALGVFNRSLVYVAMKLHEYGFV